MNSRIVVGLLMAMTIAGAMSCAASTVTVCAVLQSSAVKLRLAGDAVTSVLSAGSLIVTVAAVGARSSMIVCVPVPPSPMLTVASETA